MVKTGPYVYRADYSNVKYDEKTREYHDVDDHEDFNLHIHKGGLTVCYFSKSTFNPCKYFEPIYKHISREMTSKARFIRVDCDYPHLNNIARREEVRTFPTFTFYQNGVELVSIIGTNEMRLRHMINAYQDKHENDLGSKKLRKIRTEDEFEELIRQQNRLTVVNFYSKECILCQRILPEMEQVNAAFYDKIDFVMIDCDKKDLQQVVWDQDVRGTPSFRFYKGGRLLRAFSGLQDSELRSEIERTLRVSRAG